MNRPLKRQWMIEHFFCLSNINIRNIPNTIWSLIHKSMFLLYLLTPSGEVTILEPTHNIAEKTYFLVILVKCLLVSESWRYLLFFYLLFWCILSSFKVKRFLFSSWNWKLFYPYRRHIYHPIICMDKNNGSFNYDIVPKSRKLY